MKKSIYIFLLKYRIQILNRKIISALKYIDTLDIFEDERTKIYNILKGSEK